jgi:hypothetical protein
MLKDVKVFGSPQVLRAQAKAQWRIGRKVGVGVTALLQLATLTAKRQRSEATPLRHAVKARTR